MVNSVKDQPIRGIMLIMWLLLRRMRSIGFRVLFTTAFLCLLVKRFTHRFPLVHRGPFSMLKYNVRFLVHQLIESDLTISKP